MVRFIGKSLLSLLAFFVAGISAGGIASFIEWRFSEFSDQYFAGVPNSIWVQSSLLAATFFLAGYFVPRILNFRWAVVWLLLPLLVQFLRLQYLSPFAIPCSRSACWIIYAPFWVSAVAATIGYGIFGIKTAKEQHAA